MAAVDETFGEISERAERPFSEVKKGYTSFRSNDVLFAKITPCMQNGKVVIARELRNDVGFGSTEFHVLRPCEAVLPEWIFYFIRQPSFREEAKRNFTGTAGQQRVPTSFLEHTQIPLPPLTEQRRIVDMLARAEGIMRLRREAQQKAAELIPALFLDIFGDPATNPKHWPVVPFENVIRFTRYGPRFPNREYSESLKGGRVLRTTDIKSNGTISSDGAPMLPMTNDEIEKYSLEPNTIVVTRTGATIGKVALYRNSDEPAVAGAYLIEIRLNEQVTPEFVLHLLMSQYGQQKLTSGARAVAQPNINVPTIAAIPIPVPPLKLQRHFAAKAEAVRGIVAQQSAALFIAQSTFAALLHRAFAR